MTPNMAQAKRFLAAIAPGETHFTFQTFSDAKDPTDEERRRLTRLLHGPLDRLWPQLVDLNAGGAGIFATVNETDFRGRQEGNVKRPRAVFIDLDGAPLPRNSAVPLAAHIGVKTSPGRWHLYWRVQGVPLNAFKPIQEALAARYSSDTGVTDLPRVMRLPGFYHRKGSPYLVRLLGTRNSPPYSLDQLKAAWPQVEAALRPRPKPGRKPIRATTTVATRYAEAALTGEWQAVKNARPPTPEGEGNRNRTLNTSAFKLGTLIAAGLLTEDEVVGTLLDAVERQAKPLPSREAERTIRRAIRDGAKHPREIK